MERHPKIRDLDDLATRLQPLKAQGKKIVHCHGVFDLLHVGHIRHFEEAKALGDVLVVTLTRDEHVNKGPHRPAFPQDLRAEAIAALDAVDYVAINRWPLAVETIKLLSPTYYVKGPDYKNAATDVTGGITPEAEAVAAVGGEIRFTDGITFSSSTLLNQHLPSFPSDINDHLTGLRRRFSVADVHAHLDSLRSLKVLLVGEAILDEYIYCGAMGKSAKEPILAMRYSHREKYAGGALAVANHLAAFGASVDLVTYLGTSDADEDFVRQHLKPAVRPHFIYKSDSPTILKRRYVDSYLLSKVFEVYEMNDELLTSDEADQCAAAIEARLPSCDLAIVADFGHGLLTPSLVDLLCAKSPFLAVNTQINAANIGFHTVSKYHRANYVCIHEGEIRLDTRSRKGDLHTLASDLSARLDCDTIMVTLGKRGTLLYRRGEGFSSCPAFALKVVDRIGSGDAVLAVSSLCAARHMPADVIGFIANVVGAQAVTIMGNSRAIDRVQVLKSVDAMLK